MPVANLSKLFTDFELHKQERLCARDYVQGNFVLDSIGPTRLSTVGINEVNQRRDRLVHRWVTGPSVDQRR